MAESCPSDICKALDLPEGTTVKEATAAIRARGSWENAFHREQTLLSRAAGVEGKHALGARIQKAIETHRARSEDLAAVAQRVGLPADATADDVFRRVTSAAMGRPILA